jgi:outer membrane protein
VSFLTAPAWAFDPLHTASAVPRTPAADMFGSQNDTCTFGELPTPLGLQDAVERALCNHPKTRQAWAKVKIQAAQVGVGRAAFLPTVTGNVQRTRNDSTNDVSGYPQYGSRNRHNVSSANVSLSWVLYDFGGRAAALRNATALLAAAQANQQATLQVVFATVANDFYAAQAAQGALVAATETEQTAGSNAAVAQARVDKGVAAISDQLQAQTAHAEAVVNLANAQSDWQRALGTLASDMYLAPTTAFTLPEIGEGVVPDREFGDSVAVLIEAAQHDYPGVIAAQSQVAAARAHAAQLRAQGLPRLNLIGQYSYNNQPSSLQLGYPMFAATRRDWYVGLQLTIPIFEGFTRTYQARQANAQTELQLDVLDETRQQVGLDVWNSYQTLLGATGNLDNSATLLSLAQRSNEVALRRYETGVGNIVELLNAQSSLAQAKRKRIRALADWRSSRLQLAAKLGKLGMWSLGDKPVVQSD